MAAGPFSGQSRKALFLDVSLNRGGRRGSGESAAQTFEGLPFKIETETIYDDHVHAAAWADGPYHL
jgi:hypothetical protein